MGESGYRSFRLIVEPLHEKLQRAMWSRLDLGRAVLSARLGVD